MSSLRGSEQGWRYKSEGGRHAAHFAFRREDLSSLPVFRSRSLAREKWGHRSGKGSLKLLLYE